MTWQARSPRRTRLPSNWGQLAAFVLERDHYTCRINRPERCTQHATEVDHVQHGDDHRPTNLQAACPPCHAWKTAHEGVAARPSPRRAQPEHPATRRSASP